MEEHASPSAQVLDDGSHSMRGPRPTATAAAAADQHQHQRQHQHQHHHPSGLLAAHNLSPGPSNNHSGGPVNIHPSLHQQPIPPHEQLHHFNHLTDPTLLIDQTLRAPVSSTDFPIDPALGGGVPSETDPHLAPPPPVAQYHHPHHHELAQTYTIPQPPPPPPPPHPPVPVDPAMDGTVNTEDSQPGPSSASTSKRGSVFEDSDQELKRLAQENADIPLKELASRVREDENGPKAERARQILGMRWLLTSCERASDTSVAVPRNRVYARYVSMCANERIKPLNPASFGKLVRLMYPEIKTRRLGVRGHSKYHYCGIKLRGDPSSPAPKGSQGSASGSEPPPQLTGEDHLTNSGTIAPLDSCLFSNSLLNGHASPSSFSRPYADISPVAKFLQMDVFFPPYDVDEPPPPTKHVILPDISPYAPTNIDPDVAASLAVIYRSHCTSLVECVRYMRLKQFFSLFVSFQGTLTAPVQKLFAEPSVAPWIRESDWATYKHMIELLSPLALQVVPAPVMSALRQFSSSLTSHILATFANQPSHVIEAKTEPSAIFSSLLDRLLRVNEAAHAAARILVHSPDRTLMRQDWRKHVNCKAIVEREVPCSAAAVQRILEDEIINLLQPQPEGTNGREPTPSPGGEDEVDSLATTESVLDRWTQFLAQLPHRFPHVSPRMFLLSVGAVASAALRDMTMAGGESFGGWWVVRCWIDEWIGWTAERGGFLRHGIEDASKPLINASQINDGTDEHESELGPDDSGISLREEGIGNNDEHLEQQVEMDR